MNISCRIANADTQCGRITNPPERVGNYITRYIPARYSISNGTTNAVVTNVTIDKNEGIKWDGYLPL